MSSVLIVGSGATGVHFAATALERGHEVIMVDVGHERPKSVLPDSDFDALKEELDDPVSYFLGPHGETVVYPAAQAKFYGFPPSKSYVFTSPDGFASESNGFEPVTSFAAGGLAEAWTGGVYPLNDAELEEFPCSYADLEPHYRTVARRIGISAANDDLARFAPFSPEYQTPLETDEHSSLLLGRYARIRERLHRTLKFYLGRSRVAVLSRDLEERKACGYLGRCLWGCPRESLYAPSVTLRTLRAHPRFRYVPGMYVEHFTEHEGRISGVVASPSDGGERVTFTADEYVLAAGTLCSSRIVLDSVYRSRGQVIELAGLMDNRQMMVPFITLRMLGRPVSTHSYQFHQIAFGIEGSRADEYVHGQITALKAASIHPIVQSMPVDMRSALGIFRATHAALGVANVWLHDRRRADNVLTIRPDGATGRSRLVIRYAPDSGDAMRVATALRTMRRALWKLGAIVPPGMTKILPQGASIHYAGTLPMSKTREPWTASPDCRSHDWRNLIYADGATFPFLPAKNLTYTLMANAIRAAS
ncbi:MAG: GMC oxidoreductase, partial [Gemmatimonadota bacterium]